jgi:hypothetical protein
VRWFPVGDLPANMLDRARLALRNYANGMRFSTYPAFLPAGRTSAFQKGLPSRNGRSGGNSSAARRKQACGALLADGSAGPRVR